MTATRYIYTLTKDNHEIDRFKTLSELIERLEAIEPEAVLLSLERKGYNITRTHQNVSKQSKVD